MDNFWQEWCIFQVSFLLEIFPDISQSVLIPEQVFYLKQYRLVFMKLN